MKRDKILLLVNKARKEGTHMEAEELKNVIEEVVKEAGQRIEAKRNLHTDIRATLESIQHLVTTGDYGAITLYHISGQLHDIEDNLRILKEAGKRGDYENPDY